MNISNLYKGQVVKNYKELCKLLDIKEASGESKVSQFRELDTVVAYHKEGHKIVIDEIYDKPKPKKDGRVTSSYSIYYENFKVPKENQKGKRVYSIRLNNDIYIGSTVCKKGFKGRYKTHFHNPSNKKVYNILTKGALFEVVWLANDNTTEEEVRNMEEYYINYYRNNPEYNLLNIHYVAPILEKDKPKELRSKNTKTKSIKKQKIEKNTKPKKKAKTKISIYKDDLEKVLHILKENNIEIPIAS